MKAFIYMAFIVAFIVIFQQNPLVGVILITIVGGGYLFFKSRGHGRRVGILRSGRMPAVQDQTQTLLTYMLLQQISNNNYNNNNNHELSLKNERERGNEAEESMNEHKKARDALLELLK